MEYRDYYPDNRKPVEQEDKPVKKELRKPGVAIAAMILGIFSLTIWICSIAVWVWTQTAWILPFFASVPCSVMGFVAWRLSRREEPLLDHKYQNYVKAGRIAGKIIFLLATIFAIFMVFAIITFLSINRG